VTRTRPWDLLFVVCPGGERAGHAFLGDAERVLEHYRFCDRRLGELVEEAGSDTAVLVVSDHGMQRLGGRVLLNEWLAAGGYLALEAPARPTAIAQARVDWSRTCAWAQGYGGQIFFNVRGRDLLGRVEPERVDALADELVAGLRELPGPDGEPLRVDAFRGADLYSGPLAGRCPDLCVQLDGLRYLGSDRVGGACRSLALPAGVGEAAHSPFGFVALAGPGVPAAGRVEGTHALDVAPTALDLLGLPHDELDGRPLAAAAGRLAERG
jgi:predicted AlkP superfamily phosphohydrolase/phosphomutase